MIAFYKAGDPFGFMSNFYEAPIMVDGKLWPTTEHYYQAQKFDDLDLQETVRCFRTPNEAASKCRKWKGIRPDWDDKKYLIMRKAVLNKFLQHDNLAFQLLNTGEEELVEDTSGTIRPDAVWGNGINGEGSNWLGKILMEVRDILKGI